MLTREDVKEYVDKLIYKPGWSFESYLPWDHPAAPVEVLISHTEQDTSYPPEYVLTLPYGFDTIVAIYPDQMDVIEDVGRVILEAIISHERDMLVHEAREYFRVDDETGEYPAPFHPHHAGSNKPGSFNWRTTSLFQRPENKDLPDL